MNLWSHQKIYENNKNHPIGVEHQVKQSIPLECVVPQYQPPITTDNNETTSTNPTSTNNQRFDSHTSNDMIDGKNI